VAFLAPDLDQGVFLAALVEGFLVNPEPFEKGIGLVIRIETAVIIREEEDECAPIV
jgi:hypothetical protein